MSQGNIRSGVAWLFLGGTGNQILGFIFGIVLARLLAPADFGMLVTMQIFTGIVGFLAGGGMGQALVRAKTAVREDFEAVFSIQLVIGGLIYLALFFIAPYFAAWYDTPLYADLLRVSALTFILRPFANIPGSILQRQMRFKETSVVSILALLLTNICTILMAWRGFGVWSLVLGGLISPMLSILLLSFLAKWRPRLNWDIGRARDMIRYGMLTTAGDFIVYLRNQASNFVFSRTLGPADLGLYNKAGSLVAIPNALVTASVYQVMFRAMAKEQDNRNNAQYLFLKSITLVSIYTWPMFLALGWLALPAIRFLYGEKWVDAAPAMSWLALIGPFIVMEILAGAVLAAFNWLGREIPVQLAQLTITVLGAVAGVPYGLLGIAIGASLGTVYGAIHLSWLALRCLEMRPARLFNALWPAALITGLMALPLAGLDYAFAVTAWPGDFIYLAGMGTVGVAGYILCYLFIPIASLADERNKLRQKLSNFVK